MTNDIAATLFTVYANSDSHRVHRIIDGFRNAGLDVWTAMDGLSPGQDWSDQIAGAIDRSVGALVFLSPQLAASRFVMQEIDLLVRQQKLIIPIEIEPIASITAAWGPYLDATQRLDLTAPGVDAVTRAVADIKDAVTRFMASVSPAMLPDSDTRKVAEELANVTRATMSPNRERPDNPTSVFVVHGHDTALLETVERHLTELGIAPVVMRRIGGAQQSLFQKFSQHGFEARFALVLLSPDDIGAARRQFEADGVGTNALKFRARQNVIMELGFFYGHLGWEDVFVLLRRPHEVYPDFELPSDLHGVVYDEMDDEGRWKTILNDRLRQAGFDVD